VDFLFVLIEFLSIGVMAEALRANTDWKSAFLKGVDRSVSATKMMPTSHSSCQKTRKNDLSCGMGMWAQVSFVTNHALRDRETE